MLCRLWPGIEGYQHLVCNGCGQLKKLVSARQIL